MAGYIGSKSSVTLVDGYTEAEADAEFVNDPNDVITVSGSNVGIGTSSSYPLTVQSGTAGSNHALALRNSSNNFSRLGFLQTDSATAAYTSIDGDGRASGYLKFNTNDTERMRISSSGNVAIGSLYNGSSGSMEVSIGSTSSSGGVTLWSPTNSEGGINFGDGYSGTDRYRGSIAYNHSSDHLKFLTASTEAMRIDSSGNVLVGKTASSISTVGGQINANGQIRAIASGLDPIFVNRLTSDGDIIKIAKDGTTVGSIGVVNANNMYLSGSASNHAGVQFGTQNVTPYNNGSQSDGAVDLGAFNLRWKDAYLSGGIYLGGAVAANKLDDYEEGTWTPAFVSGTFSYGIRTGWYTKVGDLVTCGFLIIWSSKSGSGTINITLPFTTSSGAHYRYAGSTGYMSGVDIGSSYKDFTFTTTPSTANVALVLNGDNIAGAGAQVADMSGSGEIQGSLSFKV